MVHCRLPRLLIGTAIWLVVLICTAPALPFFYFVLRPAHRCGYYSFASSSHLFSFCSFSSPFFFSSFLLFFFSSFLLFFFSSFLLFFFSSFLLLFFLLFFLLFS